MNDRITKVGPGYYVINCNPRPFQNKDGQTICPPSGSVHLSFNRGGVTAEDFKAILADFVGQTEPESAEPKKRGRRPAAAAPVETVEPETAPE